MLLQFIVLFVLTLLHFLMWQKDPSQDKGGLFMCLSGATRCEQFHLFSSLIIGRFIGICLNILLGMIVVSDFRYLRDIFGTAVLYLKLTIKYVGMVQ